jgi:hypothetical protein
VTTHYTFRGKGRGGRQKRLEPVHQRDDRAQPKMLEHLRHTIIRRQHFGMTRLIILDFTADSLPLHTQNGYDGAPVDNAWLESFLAYDFGDEIPLPLQSLAPQTSSGMEVGQMDMGTAGSARMDGDTDVKGESLPKRRSQAKFRVPYFR